MRRAGPGPRPLVSLRRVATDIRLNKEDNLDTKKFSLIFCVARVPLCQLLFVDNKQVTGHF
jgi:hypothetical protein